MSNWAYPVVPVVVTDPFGYRVHPIYGDRRLHRGTDYRASYGQTVRASAGGTVIWAGYNGGEGNSVHTLHDDGTITKDFHNSSFATSKGARVSKLEKIAGAGTTGDSTGVHVHFEVHIGRDGNLIDPDAFLRSQNADADGTALAGGATPIDPIATLSEGDTMTQTLLVNQKHYFTVGEEFISHNNTLSQALTTAAINSGSDEVHNVDEAQFWDYLDGMGIPRAVVDLSAGRVQNPETGQGEENGTWSRRRQAVAKLDQLLLRVK